MLNLHVSIVENAIVQDMLLFNSDRYSPSNLVELEDAELVGKEIVPERCGREYKELTSWPFRQDRKQLEILYEEYIKRKHQRVLRVVM